MSYADDVARLATGASRSMHVCRRWDAIDSTHGATCRKCADCGCSIAVTQRVYEERSRAFASRGITLELLCDDCAAEEARRHDAAIVAMPSAEDFEAVERQDAS